MPKKWGCDLFRIWQKVESLPIPAGINHQWKKWLGNDFRLLDPYLAPEQKLATAYPCPHPGFENCPRRVVHHGPDDIVAVCGNASPQCEPITLARRDLIVRSLKTKEWLAALTKALRDINGLDAIDLDTPDGVVALGILSRRGRRVAIVWVRRQIDGVETLLRGISATANGNELVAILPPDARGQSDRLLPPGIVILTAPTTDDGDLALYRALDLFDPGYRQHRVTDQTALFDDTRIEFAEEPSVRHVVRINGQEFGGFQKSDLKFLRLLLLAAARAQDKDVDSGGWLDKFRLQGDEKDHDLEGLREEFRSHAYPSLSDEERAALVKRSPNRDGKVRLAVPPFNIRFDGSLSGLQFIGEQQTKPKSGKARCTPGQAARADNFARRDQVAKKLLDEIRKLGVPVPTLNHCRGE